MSEQEESIRLLIFLNSRERGGIEEVTLDLAKGLSRNGFEVHMAAPLSLLETFAPDLKGYRVEPVAFHLFSPRQWGEMRRFVSYLRKKRIQILNSHRFYATLFAAPLARLAGVPVVIETTHGREAWRKSGWKRFYCVDRLIERLVTINVAVCEANRCSLLSEKGYPAHKLHVIPNGRNLEQYRMASESELAKLRNEFDIDPQHSVLAVVGRLDEQKGHSYLVEALPTVAKRYPGLRVLMVGDGPLREPLEQQVEELNLQRYVNFVGFQNNVSPFYHLAEFIVLPSLYEGMPLVAIEAGAAGRTMVATSVDGILDVVVNGETGLLVTPYSSSALAEGILRLLANPEEAARLGRNARSRMESLFDQERQITDTAQLYRQCLVD